MFSFRRFDRSTTLFVGLVTVAFLVATFDVRSHGVGLGETMREGAQVLFAPLQRAATAATRPVVGFIDGLSDIAGLRDENARLQGRVDELESQIQEQQSLQNRLEELEAINDLEPPGQLSAIPAQIFSLGTSEFNHIRWINRGTADGIALNQTVIDEDGLVGSIDFVTESSARVRLITDVRFGVGVRNLETNELGTISGRGDADLQLRMFNAEKPVARGQLLVTDGTRFPAGIAVGTIVASAETAAGFLLETTVSPAIRVSEIEFVKVIVGWSPLDAVGEDDEPQPAPNAPVIGQ
jgi:rod shape-determining protein MreC